ncbi:hypothetical protein CEJ42_10660 [Herbaspirillum robiniae]|uniref:Uncharacterized protein n=2 Tax=Herbaspirillum robiniae TaxID=2014887 RepID=A0A246WSC1_9BURK|nr:hypothetical protein CEJ42_10660 [Herbaspirillum robiniae]
MINFDLTELGAKYFGNRESDIVTMSGLKHVTRPELCFATQKLISIKKTDEGKTADGRKKAVVTYQLTITPNDWAKGKDISDAFPEIRRSLQKSGKDLSRTLLNDDGKWIFAL